MPHADTFGLYANVGVKEKWPEASVVDDVLDFGAIFCLAVAHVVQIYAINMLPPLNNIR